jgi:hypothetical protein
MTHQQDERGDPVTRTHDPDRTQFSASEARQGRPGRPVLKVLGASLALVLLAWGVAEIWGSAIDPADDVDTEQTSSTSGGTQPSQDTIDTTVPGGANTSATDRDPTPQSGTGGETQQVTPDGTMNRAE